MGYAMSLKGSCLCGSAQLRCGSAPKRDPTSDRPQLVEILKEIFVRVGSRSAPIRTPYVWCFSSDFSYLLQFWPGSRFSADSHPSMSEPPLAPNITPRLPDRRVSPKHHLYRILILIRCYGRGWR